jgi:RimJ/RimL family protein N-acetyltransferase
MLSFSLLDENGIEKTIDRIMSAIPDCDRSYLHEIIGSLLDGDSEIAVSSSCGCLLIRIFDGEYSFVYPIDLTDDADPDNACDDIRLYAMKEEIPLVFTDVPFDMLGALIHGYRHVSLDAGDSDCDTYTVRMLTEVALLDEVPTLDFGEITLDSLTEADDSDYSRLSKDRDTNRFWGYDYTADADNPTDDYFRLEAEGEFNRGVAMSFAVRKDGRFVGEATLYAFDYHGGCELGIRILPEYRRGGLAGMIIDGFTECGSRLGLTNIRATVMADNLPSVGLCKKHFDSYTHEGNIYKFISEI